MIDCSKCEHDQTGSVECFECGGGYSRFKSKTKAPQKSAPLGSTAMPCSALPDNTAELLTELHGEFYGKGLANADAFRLLPRIIEKLRLHGEIK